MYPESYDCGLPDFKMANSYGPLIGAVDQGTSSTRFLVGYVPTDLSNLIENNIMSADIKAPLHWQ